jgi:hypothetical protein
VPRRKIIARRAFGAREQRHQRGLRPHDHAARLTPQRSGEADELNRIAPARGSIAPKRGVPRAERRTRRIGGAAASASRSRRVTSALARPCR